MPKHLIPAALLCLIWTAAPPPARADGFTPAQRAEIVGIVRDALRSDPSILRDAIGALQAEEGREDQVAARDAIAAHRRELVGDPADPVAGNPHGSVTVVEFYDTRCPYCRAMLPTLAALLQADPDVRLVYKDMPILGPASVLESRALLAAQRQGGYVRLQAALMHGPAMTTEQQVATAAQGAGLDPARLLADMRDPALQARLDANIRLAQALHVQGTPALVIGDGMLPGAVALPELRQAVAAARS